MATAFSEGDMTQTIGPAGWLGVCLVVVAVVLLIIAAPNKLPPSPGQESRPAAALPGPPVPDREGSCGPLRRPCPAWPRPIPWRLSGSDHPLTLQPSKRR